MSARGPSVTRPFRKDTDFAGPPPVPEETG